MDLVRPAVRGVLPLALVVSLYPLAATDLWARFGFELPAAVAADAITTEYVEFLSHWSITGTSGFRLAQLVWPPISVAALLATWCKVRRPVPAAAGITGSTAAPRRLPA